MCASMWVYFIVPQMQRCNVACFYVAVCTCIHLFIHACIHRYILACGHAQCLYAFAYTPCIELHMNISMHSFINVCIHTCVHMLVNAYKCIHKCICTWIIAPMHMCIYMHLQAEINVYMWTEAHVCLCACVHMHMHFNDTKSQDYASCFLLWTEANKWIQISWFYYWFLWAPSSHLWCVCFSKLQYCSDDNQSW